MSGEPILINPIIYAEVAPAFATQEELDTWMDLNKANSHERLLLYNSPILNCEGSRCILVRSIVA